MIYIELELNDGLHSNLEKLADEEGISIEELIVDILQDEVLFSQDIADNEYTELDDDDEEDDNCKDSNNWDDEN